MDDKEGYFLDKCTESGRSVPVLGRQQADAYYRMLETQQYTEFRLNVHFGLVLKEFQALSRRNSGLFMQRKFFGISS